MLLFNPYTFYVQIVVSCLYFYMCLFHHLIFLLGHVILILYPIYLIIIYDDGIIFVCIILYFFIRIILCIRDPCIFYLCLNSFYVTALSNLILYLFITSFDIFVYLNLIFFYLYFIIKTVLDDKHQLHHFSWFFIKAIIVLLLIFYFMFQTFIIRKIVEIFTISLYEWEFLISFIYLGKVLIIFCIFRVIIIFIGGDKQIIRIFYLIIKA